MREQAFPTEPQMHERPGESHYDYYSHSGRKEVVRYRALTERWLASYPQEHRAAWLSRFRSKDPGSLDSAFFELFLHEYVHKFCDHVEIEGAIPDSNKRADFVLHFGDGSAVAVEALSLQPTEGVIHENVHRVNEYVRQVKSADFSIWFGESGGVLKQAPPKSVVQQWARRVLGRYRWEDANLAYQQTGEMCFPVDPLRLDGWAVEAEVCLRLAEDREEREALGVLAGGGVMYHKAPITIRERIQKKISAKKASKTAMPFVLAVNIADHLIKVGEEELEVLFGFKHHVQVTPTKRGGGPIDYRGKLVFQPDGTEGVWATAGNASQYSRCDAIWFFHQVSAAHPTGTRQALYLNPYTKHDFRIQALHHYSIARVGLPE